MSWLNRLLVLFIVLGGCFALPRQEQVVLQSKLTSSRIGVQGVEIYNYQKDGIQFERVQQKAYAERQLRLTRPTLCDSSVKQYSGYFDIAEEKHLFFWFFEARHDPEHAPLMLWLNGGPGGSTIASGLLFENGPCRISSDTNDTVHNEHGWNEKTNIIYLEQPVGTGFSYGTLDSVGTLANLAEDVYVFLQLWMHRFPAHARKPLHIAGESWGGHYVPNIGHLIDEQNDRLIYAPRPGQLELNLATLTIANGLTEPASQFGSEAEYMCGGAPYPPFEPTDRRCAAWHAGTPACVRMINSCYKFQNNATCISATAFCWPLLFTHPLTESGKNFYDLREDCRDKESGLCYPEFRAIAQWLNRTSTKLALGVDADYDFKVVNVDVQTAFYKKGQAMLNSAELLIPLVNKGIRLLAYAGDTDGVCNYMGVERWMTRLEHDLHMEFEQAPSVPWKTPSGRYVGDVRVAGPGAGNVTFVRVFDAGHMAPFDQPEATLDMITKWIDNESFA